MDLPASGAWAGPKVGRKLETRMVSAARAREQLNELAVGCHSFAHARRKHISDADKTAR